MVDRSLYKVGIVLSVGDCGGGSKSGGGKVLKACKVNVGDESDPLTVVTSATNVREGSRLAVAPVGSTFEDDNGEEVTVKKTSVGGVVSEGVFCDSKMLGWSGGAEGVAAQIPDSVEIGAPPPATKPRPGGGVGQSSTAEDSSIPPVEVQGLFEKKLSKEEKKKLAEEKRKARKAAKEAKNKE